MSPRRVAVITALMIASACNVNRLRPAQPRTINTLDAPAQEFSATDQNNKPVTLSDAVAKGITVLVFYRGNW